MPSGLLKAYRQTTNERWNDCCYKQGQTFLDYERNVLQTSRFNEYQTHASFSDHTVTLFTCSQEPFGNTNIGRIRVFEGHGNPHKNQKMLLFGGFKTRIRASFEYWPYSGFRRPWEPAQKSEDALIWVFLLAVEPNERK